MNTRAARAAGAARAAVAAVALATVVSGCEFFLLGPGGDIVLEVSVFATGGGTNGDEITVTILNSGEGDVDGMEMRLAVSVDQTITANDHAAYSENLVIGSGEETTLTVSMGDVDANVNDGFYYLGVILDPDGQLIEGTPPAVASTALWEVRNGFLVYTLDDAFEADDDDTGTAEVFTLGTPRSHTITPPRSRLRRLRRRARRILPSHGQQRDAADVAVFRLLRRKRGVQRHGKRSERPGSERRHDDRVLR